MKHYQAVVIGGGIVGAGIFRDLALHGVEALLIEKNDFSSQTSQSSSKLLHGGIRYLENMDFELVFEALHEKNLLLSLLPHLAHEVPFYLPVYSDAKRPLWMIKIGMFLYDLLSSFQNSPHRISSADNVLKEIPGLKKTGLKGAGVYYDGVMDDAKITLEVIYDALKEANVKAMSHVEVVDVTISGKLNIIQIKDQFTKEISTVSSDQVIYALGPFTDRFLSKIPMYNWQNILLPSKGSHIWIKADDLPLTFPIVITTNDGRVIFVIPHGDRVLVGTTEVPFDGDYFNVQAGLDEINYLLNAVNNYFPTAQLKREHILSSFAGIRPLVSEGNNSLGKTSREHKIYQPMSNTFVIAGGKYTTFRIMGQEITRQICHLHGKSYNQDFSKKHLRTKSLVTPFAWHRPTSEELKNICINEMPKTFEDLVIRRLSISNRAHWNLRSKDIEFNDFFIEHFDLLKNYIQISKEDIINFL